MDEQSREVIQVYDHLAPTYDRRWARYIRASTEAAARRINLQIGESLLDVGCGTGALLQRLAADHVRPRLAGIEPSPAMLEIARTRLPPAVRLLNAGAERLPFDDGEFDVVASTSAFHFFADPVAALREFRRVLRPGGRVVITDWCDDYLTCRLCDWWLRLVDRAHTRLFGAATCQRMVEQAGFHAVAVERYKITWLWGMMTATGMNGPA